jgi:hypothetical protein
VLKSITLNLDKTTVTYYKGGNFYLNEEFNSTGYNFYATLNFNYSQYGQDYVQERTITSYYWNQYQNHDYADGEWYELSFHQSKYRYKVDGFSAEVTDTVQSGVTVRITLNGITDPDYLEHFEYQINILDAVPGNIWQNTGDMHRVYEFGEEFYLIEDETIGVEYTDKTWETVPLTADMITDFDTTVPGIRKTFTIKYGNVTTRSKYTQYTVKPKPEAGYTVMSGTNFYYCLPDSMVYVSAGLYVSPDGYGVSAASYSSSTSISIINGQFVVGSSYTFNFNGYTEQDYKNELLKDDDVSSVEVISFVRYTQFGTPILDIQASITLTDGTTIYDRWAIARASGAYVSVSMQSISDDLTGVSAIFDAIVASIVA